MTSEEIQKQIMDIIHKEGHELPNNEYFSMLHEIAVPDLLEALKFVRDAPQFKRRDWKLKVTIDAAIAKAKLI